MTSRPFIVKNGLVSNGPINGKVGTITGSDLDLSTGDYFNFTPTADTTFTFSNPASSDSVSRFALDLTGAAGTVGYQNIENLSVKQFIPRGGTLSLAWADDNTKIAVATYNGIGILGLETPGTFASTDKYLFDGYVQKEITSGSIQGMAFSPDGLKFYGSNGSTVYQYTLTTPFKLSTATYDSKSKSIGSGSKCIFFSNDGTKLFSGRSSNNMDVYTLSTAWDVSTAGTSTPFNHSAQTSSVYAGNISSDGTKMVIADASALYEYTLSTANDPSTAGFVQSHSETLTSSWGRAFSPEGDKYVMQTTTGNGGLKTITLSTPWDVSTASALSAQVNFPLPSNGPYGATFGDGGTRLYTWIFDYVYQYSLSEAYNLSTATYLGFRRDPGYSITTIYDMLWSPDGTKATFFGVQNTAEYIWTTACSTAWDITTALNAGSNYSGSIFSTFGGMSWGDSGNRLYIFAGDSDVYEYELSTPYTIYVGDNWSSVNPADSPNTAPTAVYFNENGTKMYLADTDSVFDRYSLGTAWDLSTYSYDSVTFSHGFYSADELKSSHFEDEGKLLVVVTESLHVIIFDTSGAGSDFTFTYPAAVEWPSGTAPTTPGSGQTDLLEFVTRDGGTTYLGYLRGDNFS